MRNNKKYVVDILRRHSAPTVTIEAAAITTKRQAFSIKSLFFFRFHIYYLLVRGSRIAGTFLRLPCRITGTNFLACHPQFFFFSKVDAKLAVLLEHRALFIPDGNAFDSMQWPWRMFESHRMYA